MHSLDQEMRIFSAAVLSDRPGVEAGSLQLHARPGADPYARLSIYRNNTLASLTGVLLAVFPVTVRLLDERYFRFAGHAFITAFPPSEPRLTQFGEKFPAFLARSGDLREMPFVAETARLEWAIANALDSGHDEPIHIGVLLAQQDPSALHLRLQPSLRLMLSRCPVGSIWATHQEAREPELGFVLERGAERIALWRNGSTVRMLLLDIAGFAFLHAVARGLSLEAAARRAARFDPLFDLAAALARLFSEGLVTAASAAAH
jgi:hypothetical protein